MKAANQASTGPVTLTSVLKHDPLTRVQAHFGVNIQRPPYNLYYAMPVASRACGINSDKVLGYSKVCG